MLNLNKCTKAKPKPRPAVNFKNSSYVCVHITVYECRKQHSTEQY